MNKPPYRVPTMSEIRDISWNGFNVVSTFSGAGGSCLGYRMAGFRVLWANEFVPMAQATYKQNHPDSILDTRDIREIGPHDILTSTGLRQGDIDLFDGSPPCAAFSTAGRKDKGWGKVKSYSDTQQRVDDLFFEYARLVKGVQPKVFIAENVSGLIKGKSKGYFKFILSALKDCGYNVSASVLNAQWLGVPQKRQRLIFIGIRKDLDIEPVFPRPLSYTYSIKDAFSGSTRLTPVEDVAWYNENPIGKAWDNCPYGKAHSVRFSMKRPDLLQPCFTITQTTYERKDGGIGAAVVSHPLERRAFSIAELKRICAFPDDYQLSGTFAQQWERLSRAVPPVMMYRIAETVKEDILCKIQ